MLHQPVLLKEVINALNVPKGGIVLDGTVGSGGHMKALCDVYGEKVRIIALDADEDSIKRAKYNLTGCNVDFYTKNFEDFPEVLKTLGVSEVHAMLFDLGWSSDQFETSGRGFSFQTDEPLVMTYTKNPEDEQITAYDVVNNWREETLKDILRGFGEERFPGRIAKAITEARKEKPIVTTFELADIVKKAVPRRFTKSHLHPATQTFQAIRIAVNRELEVLEKALSSALPLLSPEGRLVVITFHSIEDRIVKRFMKEMEREGRGRVITKKPLVAGEEELKSNPRSRSAKLRVYEKKNSKN